MKNKIIAIIITLIIVIMGIFIVLKVVNKSEQDKQNEIEVTDEIHKEAEEFAATISNIIGACRSAIFRVYAFI